MPIYLSTPFENMVIQRISGNEKMRAHLNNLGFIEGEPIMVVSCINQNVIVKIKGISMALTHDLAKNIHVVAA